MPAVDPHGIAGLIHALAALVDALGGEITIPYADIVVAPRLECELEGEGIVFRCVYDDEPPPRGREEPR